MEEAPNPDRTDFSRLVAHRESVQADDTLETVHKRFAQHKFDFMLVLDGRRMVGLCSRQEVGMTLGARYGFALHSCKPIRENLVSQTTCISIGQPVSDVLATVFSRPDSALFDDVVLLDETDTPVGLIFARALARLQNQMLLRKVEQLQVTQLEINQKNEQLQDDLRLAREIQLAMLPDHVPSVPANGSSLRFCHRYLPAGVVSGDLFHVVRVSEHAAGVFICDVMGHGVRSAFVAAVLRTLVEELTELRQEPGQLLTRMNVELKSILRQSSGPMFATALYLVADLDRGEVRFARAGHPSPLRLRHSSGEVTALNSEPGTTGPALGFFPVANYGTSQASLDCGDSILLFTDGLYEVPYANEEEFGRARLLAAIQDRSQLPLEDLVDDLLSEIRSHSPTHEFADDVCVVGLEVACVESGAPVPAEAVAQPG
jgi:serine phosphatase RsbU (regulator of sigma subunit)